jgi:hypothetical protein
MPSVNDVIVQSLVVSQTLLQRYTADLTDPEYLHRPAGKANCAAWTIGHLTLSERKALQQFGVEPPPLPEGYAERFSQKEGCPQAETFGDVRVLMPLFNEHRNRLVEAVRGATPGQLDKPLERAVPPLFSTLGELANFLGAHAAMHAGQISTIRRSLGRPPLV